MKKLGELMFLEIHLYPIQDFFFTLNCMTHEEVGQDFS